MQALVRAQMLNQHLDITQHIAGVAFLGTPHRGSDVGRHGRLVTRILHLLGLGSDNEIFDGLHYDSDTLKDLHSDFISTFGSKIAMVNFFEERKTRLSELKVLNLRIWKWDEYVSNGII